MSCHKNESSWTVILFYKVCNLSLNWPLWEERSLQHTEENYFGWASCQSQFMKLNFAQMWRKVRHLGVSGLVTVCRHVARLYRVDVRTYGRIKFNSEGHV